MFDPKTHSSITALNGLLERYASTPRPNWIGRILMAAFFTLAFMLLRFAIVSLMGFTVGFSLLLPAVLLAALGGGLATALLTIVFCTVALTATLSFAVLSGDAIAPYWAPAIAFWIIGTFSALVGSSLKATLQRLTQTQSELIRISEQHLASANDMRALFDQASAGIVRTDTRGHILQANPRFCEILGRDFEELSDRCVTEFTHADDATLTAQTIRHLNDGKVTGWQVEKRYVRPDGESVHTLVNTRPVHGTGGKPQSFLSLVVDITSARRTENALRISRHSFDTIANSIPVLLWMTDTQFKGNYVNQAYLDFTGHELEKVTSDMWMDLLHPDDRARVLVTFDSARKSLKPFSITARYRRRDGQWRWLRSMQQPRFGPDGQLLGAIGTAFDITDSQEASARLEESEARFRTVANSAPAMIWMVDEQGRTEFGNRRFRSAFSGNLPARLTAAWHEMTHPDDRDGLMETLTEAQRTQRKFSFLGRIQHPTFGERWIRSEAAPRHNSHGMLIGFTGVSLDVTDSQRAEHDLKRINEILEERVTAVLAEKAKAEAELVRSNRLEAIGRLTGGVAHDFNNLLTVIIGGLDIILRTDDADRRKKIGDAALAAARRGERLTSQLLAFSRRQTLSPSLTDLNALISEGEPLLTKALSSGMSLTIDLIDGTAPTVVDPAKFEAALLNLLVNARDASPENGNIIVQTARFTLDKDKRKSSSLPIPPDLALGEYVLITVSDCGTGMTEDVQKRVFEPFFTTKGVGHGTGLGLSQVYGFTRQSGGSISIQSILGQGTSIHLFLPWSTSIPASTPTGEAAENLEVLLREPAKPLRILLVEDNHEVASIISAMINTEGYMVERVENAESALNRLQTQNYDVVISDILMPGGMNGIELAQQLALIHPKLPVILSSGYPGEAENIKSHPWPFLPKPYTSEQLRALLSKY